jgi:serine protease AprX
MNPGPTHITWHEPARYRRKSGAARMFGVALSAALMLVVLDGPALADARMVQVVVRARSADIAPAEAQVVSSGGSVLRRLGIINGFAAVVPARSIAALQSRAEIYSVTPNAPVQFAAQVDGYDPNWATPVGSWKRVVEAIRAKDVWKAGFRGQGVDVALIDSGVLPVDGIGSQLVYGPDLSFESQAENLRYLDSYGHGTFMAGLIAGRDNGIADGQEDERLDKAFVGIAPEARVVSVKVASDSGATDVSQVLAAIDWVVQHRHSDGLNIRVLNLSFGTDSTQSYIMDPLAYAAEVAWRAGIVVVVSAGNSNFGSSRLNDPAFDPFVIAVGADDTKGTNDPKDDVVPAWSARGDGVRGPDLVAPGRSVVSLRARGSQLDLSHPEAAVGNSRFFKGSGTSQSAAVVSGAVALLLSQRPNLTPDQVKYLLESTAARLPSADLIAQGSGLINVKAAKDTATPPALLAAQTFPASTGLGSLEAARGSVHVADGGTELVGERDIFGSVLTTTTWAPGAAEGTTWVDGSWNGNTWTGNTWTGNTWTGNTWTGNTWTGNTWTGNTWTGNTWTGSFWASAYWAE